MSKQSKQEPVPDISLDLRPEHRSHAEGAVTLRRYRRARGLAHAFTGGLEAMWTDRDDPRCAAILEHVVRAIEAAHASWTGASERDAKARRVDAVIRLLDLARERMQAGDQAGHAAMVAERLAPLLDPELRRIPLDAWQRAVEQWQGEQPAPRGNPHGRKRYDWCAIVLALLQPRGLTDATHPRGIGNLRQAAKKRAKLS